MYTVSKGAFIKLFILMTVLVAAGYLLVYQVALNKVDEKIKNQPNKGGSVSISITDLQKDFVSLQQGTGSPQTGNINITGNIQAQGEIQGGSLSGDSLTIDNLNGVLKADQGAVSGGATTSDVPEGTNKYYTDDRVNQNLSSKTTNNITEGTNNLYYTGDRFNQSLGTKTTDNLTEGTTNQYYTDSRAREAISGSSSVDYNSATGSISLPDSGVTTGTYGDGTHVGQFTVDAYGRVTSSADVLITGAAPVGAAGGDLTGNFPNPTISASWGGVAGINTLGTINTGTWHGTAIQDAYIASSANWNTAYSERNQWDGGATGLNALTGRTSLGLGSVENTALSTWGGTSNINTIGNVTSGTVNGQTISSSANFTGTITAAGTINGANISGGTLTASAVNGVTTADIILATGSYSDPTWLTVSKSGVGLGNVENTALSTWNGTSNINTVGTITSGTWNAGAITSSGAIQGTSVTATGLTLGSVLFAGTGGALSQDNSNLFWDNTNKRLGIGTTSPATLLQVAGAVNIPLITGIAGGTTVGLGENDRGSNYAGASLFVNGNMKLTADSNGAVMIGDDYQGIDGPDNGLIISGKVGIGTTSPGTTLTVRSATAGNIIAVRDTADTTNTFTVTDAGAITAATSISVPSITTSGAGISFNSKNLTSVGTIGSGAITSTGAIQGTSLNVGSGAITSGLINGQTISSSANFTGTITIPTTTNSTTGVIYKGAAPFIHNFNLAGTNGYNTFVGLNSGNFTMTGSTGYQGSYNIGIGQNTLQANTTGWDNVAVGAGALQSNTTGNDNSAMGDYALHYNTTGYWNAAMGSGALDKNTTGYWNAAMGGEALYSNTTGNENSATGECALCHNTMGNYNSAMGAAALFSNTIGSYNTGIGYKSLWTTKPTVSGSITAFSNSTVEPGVKTRVTSASHGRSNGNWITISNSTNYKGIWIVSNVSAPDYFDITQVYIAETPSGTVWTLGGGNTALGSYAGRANTTGTANTFLGYNAGRTSTATLQNATAIGYEAQVTASNALILGGTGANAVNVGIGVTAPGATLTVRSATAGNIIAVRDTADTTNTFTVTDAGVVTAATSISVPSITTSGTDIAFNSKNLTGVGTISSGAITSSGAIQGTSLTATGLTQGSVAFAGAGGLISQDNSNLFWDNGNKRLGIGTTNPGNMLDIYKSVNALNGGPAIRLMRGYEGSGYGSAIYTGWQNAPGVYETLVFGVANNGDPTAAGRERMVITSSGGVGIGTVNPGTAGLAIMNGNVGIGTTAPVQKIEVDHGNMRFDQEAAPGAPTVAVNATAGNLNGNYYYRVTFVTALGETEAGTVSAVVSPANQQVDLSAIPVGSSWVTSRKIYRTVAGAGWPYISKLVTTLNNNTATTYTDNTADGSLGVFGPGINTTGGALLVGSENSMEVDYAITRIGIGAGSVNKGLNNVFIGFLAGQNNTTAFQNTAVGSSAFQANTTGQQNTAVGGNALHFNTAGGGNAAIGLNALFSNTTGGSNTGIGSNVLYSNQTGAQNVALGYQAGYLSTGARNIFLGYQAGYNETGSDKLYIDSTNTVTPLIKGDFAAATRGITINGQMAATDGVVTKVNAGACSDAVFNVDVDGTMCIDSTNFRLYFRYGGAWHYTAQTAGFQIPDFETTGINPGDFLIPYAESRMEDGAIHGLYKKWSDVKAELIGGTISQINQLASLSVDNLTVKTATIDTLIVTGDAAFKGTLTVNGHIITGGNTPMIIAEVGAGMGAIVAVDGNDTSGTITVTTGTGPSAGLLATITFAKAYGSAPNVILEPKGSSGATLQHYTTPATTNFTLNSGNDPATSTAYTYSYMVMQ